MNAPRLHLHRHDLDQPAEKRELPGLNTVRAIAALGVVLLHACVPYLEHPMPGLQWSVQDTASTPVDHLFWAIEIFIMPIFLVLAGFLAWQTLSRKGQTKLLRSRAKRLLIPLLFGMIVVLPVDLYIWIAGWIGDGLVSPVKLKSLKFDGAIAENIWGLSHLWFLLYLFLYVAATSAIALASKRFEHFEQFQRRIVAEHPWMIVTSLVLVGVFTLTLRPEVVWGFQHAFAPVPSKWIYSGTFFVGGLLLAYADPGMEHLKRHTLRIAPVAVLFLAAAVMLGRWHLGAALPAGASGSAQQQSGSPLFAQSILGLVTTAAAWLTTLAIIGIAVRTVRRNRNAMKYLAAASFWIYLVHHPLLGLVHIDLKWLLPNAPSAVKTAVAFAISVSVSLLLYEAFVRQTVLGRTLGFAWNGPGKAPVVSPATQIPAEERRVAA